jgi:hypothetical protein
MSRSSDLVRSTPSSTDDTKAPDRARHLVPREKLPRTFGISPDISEHSALGAASPNTPLLPPGIDWSFVRRVTEYQERVLICLGSLAPTSMDRDTRRRFYQHADSCFLAGVSKNKCAMSWLVLLHKHNSPRTLVLGAG